VSVALLLDTHAWIWFAAGDRRMKPRIAALIQDARKVGALFVSPITIWEIGMLVSKERIVLGQSCEDWIGKALMLPGLRLAALEPEIALAASFLPGECHGDPADRILIATARHLGIPLATADAAIHGYGAQGYVKVVKL